MVILGSSDTHRQSWSIVDRNRLSALSFSLTASYGSKDDTDPEHEKPVVTTDYRCYTVVY